MKLLPSIAFVFCLSIFLLSCGNKSDDASREAPEQITADDTNPAISAGDAPEHYICPNGHIGSGGAAAGTCSQCGAALEHNAAFHDTPPPDDLLDISAQPGADATAASGVEHYTCPNGHIGSGGPEAGTCSQCGATLEHNAAFHSTPPPDDLLDISTQPNADVTAATGVEHYTCPNGHVGSGGPEAGTCSQCGATLEHNAAFHNTPPPDDNNLEILDFNSTPPAGAQTASSPAPGVEHYICPNGHFGSGGPSEGVCSECSATLVHNNAFHANDVQNTTSNPATSSNSGAAPVITSQPADAVSPVFRQNPVNVNTNLPNPAASEPAQNAAGVWHYVCNNGCSGGSGSAVACRVCGSTLVHNPAYHN